MIEWFYENQMIYIFITFTGLILSVIFSIYYRKKKGKPILGDPEVQILFKENNASGCSKKNIITRVGVSNCLKVILSNNELIISPVFPFNLLFPEFFDLEHFINYDEILEVRDGFMKNLNIVFKNNGEIKEINIRLDQKEKFISIIKSKINVTNLAI